MSTKPHFFPSNATIQVEIISPVGHKLQLFDRYNYPTLRQIAVVKMFMKRELKNCNVHNSR